jgi:hypothetical protein
MFGADPYLAERSMELTMGAVRHEVHRSGLASVSHLASGFVRRLSLMLVGLGGRLVRAGLPPYEASAASNPERSASPGGATV